MNKNKKAEAAGIKALERFSTEMWEDLLRTILGERLARMERMLEWLIIDRIRRREEFINEPDISDIITGIDSRMKAKKHEQHT